MKNPYQQPVCPPVQDWRDEAVCLGSMVDLWFAEDAHHVAKAVEACEQCPVQVQCLKFAIDTNQRFGVWGGKTAQERDALRQRVRIPRRFEETNHAGTEREYHRHLVEGTVPCPQCRRAHAKYTAEKRQRQRDRKQQQARELLTME
jgi:hypothetical protein